jgi:hypothetical protein
MNSLTQLYFTAQGIGPWATDATRQALGMLFGSQAELSPMRVVSEERAEIAHLIAVQRQEGQRP